MEEQIDSVARLMGDAIVIDEYGRMLRTEMQAYAATQTKQGKQIVTLRTRLIRLFLTEIEQLLEEEE